MPAGEPYYHREITARGQITLPAKLRQLPGIKPGDSVELRADESNGSPVIMVRRRHSLIEATAGIARPKVPYTPQEGHEVEDIVKEEVAQRFQRQSEE